MSVVRLDNVKKVVVMLALLVVLAACKSAQPPLANETNISVPDTSNTAQFGDLVVVNYIMTLENGSVADTNNETLARQHGLKNYATGPATFVLGQSGKIPGFDKQISGMKVGDQKKAVIEPTEKLVVVTLDKVQGMKRSVEFPVKRLFKRSSYESLFGKPPVLGDVISNPQFTFRYQVINVTNTSVLTRAVVTEGTVYQLENLPWPSKLASILKKEDVGIFVHVPEVNKTFASEFGPAKVIDIASSKLIVEHDPALHQLTNKSITINGVPIAQTFEVIALTNETFTLQRYGLLTDKPVHFSVELLNLTKEVKTVRKESIPFFHTH